jgi:hypothetical protein
MEKIMPLPPKMLADYAQKARDGKADEASGGGCFDFYVARQRISVILCGDDHAVGHVQRMTTSAWDAKMKELGRA